jgi:hypothetical protein
VLLIGDSVSRGYTRSVLLMKMAIRLLLLHVVFPVLMVAVWGTSDLHADTYYVESTAANALCYNPGFREALWGAIFRVAAARRKNGSRSNRNE